MTFKIKKIDPYIAIKLEDEEGRELILSWEELYTLGECPICKKRYIEK